MVGLFNDGDVLQPLTNGYRINNEWGVVAGLQCPARSRDASRTHESVDRPALKRDAPGRQQINAVFTAIQNKEKGRLVEGVDLTVQKHVRANVFMGSQVSYISDYEATGGGDGDISALNRRLKQQIMVCRSISNHSLMRVVST